MELSIVHNAVTWHLHVLSMLAATMQSSKPTNHALLMTAACNTSSTVLSSLKALRASLRVAEYVEGLAVGYCIRQDSPLAQAGKHS